MDTPPTAQVRILNAATIAALKADLRGEVVLPGDTNYDAVRRVWNGLIDKRPAAMPKALAS